MKLKLKEEGILEWKLDYIIPGKELKEEPGVEANVIEGRKGRSQDSGRGWIEKRVQTGRDSEKEKTHKMRAIPCGIYHLWTLHRKGINAILKLS